MKHNDPVVPKEGTLSISTTNFPARRDRGQNVATRDHVVIRAWAARHGAEPATGEATTSGPATVSVNDGGVGIRFNFPGVARFRPISWDEWFEHFDRYRLAFIYQEEVADRAHALWRARGGDHGSDLQDWFEAERQLRELQGGQVSRYWFVQQTSEDD